MFNLDENDLLSDAESIQDPIDIISSSSSTPISPPLQSLQAIQDKVIDVSFIQRLCSTTGLKSNYIKTIAHEIHPFITELLLKLDHFIHPTDNQESIASLKFSMVHIKNEHQVMMIDSGMF